MFLSWSGSNDGLDLWDERSFLHRRFQFLFFRRLILHDDRFLGHFQDVTCRKGSAFPKEVAGENPFQSEVLRIKLHIAAFPKSDTAFCLNDLSHNFAFVLQKGSETNDFLWWHEDVTLPD